MIINFDPGTLLAITAATQVAGTLGQAGTAAARGEAEAGAIRQSARREAVQRGRDLRDLGREQGRFLSRSRAAFAAQGADTASGTALAVLTAQAGEFGVRRERVRSDSIFRQRQLEQRAEATEEAARAESTGLFLRAVGQGFSGANTVFRENARTGGETED